MTPARVLGLALLSGALAACRDGGGGPTAPDPKYLVIAVQGGDQQIWSPSGQVPKPLQVVVKDSRSKNAVGGVTVLWKVTQGSGATLNPPTSVTDSTGIASTTLTLGPAAGSYTVTADFNGNLGQPATFRAEAASGAQITGITPTSARSGDTITVAGNGFSSTAQNNVVLFDGVRGAVVSATASQLRVIVPLCLPTRTVQVVVLLGAASTPPASLAVTGTGGGALNLTVGKVALLTDPTAISCATLSSGSYLVVVENATDVSNRPMDFQLLGLAGGTAASAFAGASATVAEALAQSDFATDFETRLRENEQQLLERAQATGGGRPDISATGASAIPNVGDTATFNVLNTITGTPAFTKVRAVVKAVTTTSIIWQDVNAPAGGFAATDFQRFGQLFDDPIYPTDTSVFGAVSDIDGNSHVDILFTPVVNAMTPKGSASFVAGFFYGCDLLPANACSGTNRAEVFYASVPDPNGSVGPILSIARILQTTPPVLAHEFMHMIHWNQRQIVRNAGDDALWVDEALAHTAEDTVGGVYLSRGDTANAVLFMSENWRRANNYLQATAATSLLASVAPGSLAERGAGWLFIKYLRGRFGGSILGRLVQTTLSSTANVTAAAGLGWNVLVNDFDIALWADDAPELAGAALDPRYTFPNINLRKTLGQSAFGGVYLLQPLSEPFGAFNTAGTVLSATSAYYTVSGTGASPLGLSLAAPRGLPFGSDVVPQLGVLRYR